MLSASCTAMLGYAIGVVDLENARAWAPLVFDNAAVVPEASAPDRLAAVILCAVELGYHLGLMEALARQPPTVRRKRGSWVHVDLPGRGPDKTRGNLDRGGSPPSTLETALRAETAQKWSHTVRHALCSRSAPLLAGEAPKLREPRPAVTGCAPTLLACRSLFPRMRPRGTGSKAGQSSWHSADQSRPAPVPGPRAGRRAQPGGWRPSPSPATRLRRWTAPPKPVCAAHARPPSTSGRARPWRPARS